MKKWILLILLSLSLFAENEARIAFFPNLTHGQALIGKNQKTFENNIKDYKITWKKFNGGPEAIEAFLSQQVDIGYVGPGPAMNGFVKTKGDLFIIGGASKGGAVLVVRKDSNIKTVKDLSGKKIAIPQIGNTQDIILRNLIKNAGLKPSYKGGTVDIVHADNPYIKTLLDNKYIDGALVPEPWGSRLVKETGAKIILDSKELYNNGNYATAVIIVRKEFYEKNKEFVEKFLKTHLQLTEFLKNNKEESKEIINNELKILTGKTLSKDVINSAFERVEYTNDPQVESTKYFLDLQVEAGFIREKPDVKNLFNLEIINSLLKSQGKMKI